MEFDKNGRISCKCCHGRKVIPKTIPRDLFRTLCPECKGEGGTDWINKAMHNVPTPQEIQHQVTYQNILNLIHLARDEAASLGMEIDVNIKYTHYNEKKQLYGLMDTLYSTSIGMSSDPEKQVINIKV